MIFMVGIPHFGHFTTGSDLLPKSLKLNFGLYIYRNRLLTCFRDSSSNGAGGFEALAQLEGNHWHKTSLGPKAISAFLLQPTAAWLYFEGLPDFGSFLTLDRPPTGTFNYLVLNGTGMTAKAIAFLETQPVGSLTVCSQAGEGAATVKAALLAWAARQGWQHGDIDHKWRSFGDLNEKLMHQQSLNRVAQPVSGRSVLKNIPKLDQ